MATAVTKEVDVDNLIIVEEGVMSKELKDRYIESVYVVTSEGFTVVDVGGIKKDDILHYVMKETANDDIWATGGHLDKETALHYLRRNIKKLKAIKKYSSSRLVLIIPLPPFSGICPDCELGEPCSNKYCSEGVIDKPETFVALYSFFTVGDDSD